jgi:hypothetical protein
MVVWYIPVDDDLSSRKTERILISIIDFWTLSIFFFSFKTTFRRLGLFLYPQAKSLFIFTTVERRLSELISDKGGSDNRKLDD